MRLLAAATAALSILALSPAPRALETAPIEYRLSFPEPEHHWMQVEVTFPGLPPGHLEVRMSRTSPGRYALHEFSRQVSDVRVFNGSGEPLSFIQPNLHQWDVKDHDGTVRVVYRVFGNRVDGTYLSIDSTHAHINIPAALMWARGLDNRPVRVSLERPPVTKWRAATQLYGTEDPLSFEAPNFWYFMDSPIEFSDFDLATFKVSLTPGAAREATFRVALHHTNNDSVEEFAADLRKIVEVARDVYGELPEFEPGSYTFLVDYLPWANGDGMEHRNSTVLTSTESLGIPEERISLLSSAAHELFHVWNVERIRPASLEPFDFEEANVSGELWLGEGVTSYYDGLLLQRAGLRTIDDTAGDFLSLIQGVVLAPGRQFRSAVEMSRLAPFVDSASWIDPTNWQNTYISYYTFGAAIGLGLDLTLRDRSNGRVTLDDFMRAMWRQYGKPGGRAPGLVSKPYTLEDARHQLAEVSGDAAFAKDFFDRYIEGREVVPYERLLARAGLVLRPRRPGRAWLGNVDFEFSPEGARITAPTLAISPIYQAGLDRGDILTMLDGVAIRTPSQVDTVVARHRPGDRLSATFLRNEQSITTTILLVADPYMELVRIEQTRQPLTSEAQAFREAWLGAL